MSEVMDIPKVVEDQLRSLQDEVKTLRERVAALEVAEATAADQQVLIKELRDRIVVLESELARTRPT